MELSALLAFFDDLSVLAFCMTLAGSGSLTGAEVGPLGVTRGHVSSVKSSVRFQFS